MQNVSLLDLESIILHDFNRKTNIFEFVQILRNRDREGYVFTLMIAFIFPFGDIPCDFIVKKHRNKKSLFTKLAFIHHSLFL